DLLSCFFDIYPNDYTQGSGCQEHFQDFYNAWTQSNLVYSQIAALYYSTCGITLNVCTNCSHIVTCWLPSNCHTIFAPYYLSAPEPMPEFLKCGYGGPQCLSCSQMVTYTNEFKTKFSAPYNGGPNFGAGDLTPEQI